MQKKIKEAQAILRALSLPPEQQTDMSALTILALSGIKKDSDWSEATASSHTLTKGIMNFVASEYKKTYAANTRETFRRQVLHQFVQAGVARYNPDQPNLPTNSPNAHYALTPEAHAAISHYGKSDFGAYVTEFIDSKGSLSERYARDRETQFVKLNISNQEIVLSPGKHNALEASIVEQFLPFFAPESQVCYVGDTANKAGYVNQALLDSIGIPLSVHDKLPDVILYDEGKRWLFLFEAVTSHGPMTPKRMIELEELFEDSKFEKIYISAFPDRSEYRKHAGDISWETEVWIAEQPTHMIHYNGDKFMGPRS